MGNVCVDPRRSFAKNGFFSIISGSLWRNRSVGAASPSQPTTTSCSVPIVQPTAFFVPPPEAKPPEPTHTAPPAPIIISEPPTKLSGHIKCISSAGLQVESVLRRKTENLKDKYSLGEVARLDDGDDDVGELGGLPLRVVAPAHALAMHSSARRPGRHGDGLTLGGAQGRRWQCHGQGERGLGGWIELAAHGIEVSVARIEVNAAGQVRGKRGQPDSRSPQPESTSLRSECSSPCSRTCCTRRERRRRCVGKEAMGKERARRGRRRRCVGEEAMRETRETQMRS